MHRFTQCNMLALIVRMDWDAVCQTFSELGWGRTVVTYNTSVNLNVFPIHIQPNNGVMLLSPLLQKASRNSHNSATSQEFC